jgi:hypothetical protein
MFNESSEDFLLRIQVYKWLCAQIQSGAYGGFLTGRRNKRGRFKNRVPAQETTSLGLFSRILFSRLKARYYYVKTRIK